MKNKQVRVLAAMGASVVAYVVIVAISPILVPIGIARSVIVKKPVSDYLTNIAIGFDQAGGSLLYSQEDWTISSYTYYLCRKNNRYACGFKRVIDAIFGRGHCEKSYRWEVAKTKRDIAEIDDVMAV